MGELVLGCKPCVEKVAVSGDDSSIRDTVRVANEQGYDNFPQALTYDNKGGWSIERGLEKCPVTGSPCPNSGRINDAAELILKDLTLTILDQPTELGNEGLDYLVPATISNRLGK